MYTKFCPKLPAPPKKSVDFEEFVLILYLFWGGGVLTKFCRQEFLWTSGLFAFHTPPPQRRVYVCHLVHSSQEMRRIDSCTGSRTLLALSLIQYINFAQCARPQSPRKRRLFQGIAREKPSDLRIAREKPNDLQTNDSRLVSSK